MVQGEEGEIVASFNLIENIGVTVICLCIKIASKRCFRVSFEDRPIQTPFVINEKGFVVAYHFSTKADDKKNGEENQAVIAAPV